MMFVENQKGTIATDFVQQRHPSGYEGNIIGSQLTIQDGPEKNRTAYFPQYVDAITGISMYEVTSPEKNDTKINNLGSVVYFLGHILWNNVKTKIFPSSA